MQIPFGRGHALLKSSSAIVRKLHYLGLKLYNRLLCLVLPELKYVAQNTLQGTPKFEQGFRQR